jgi:restriction endonuclease S subunit
MRETLVKTQEFKDSPLGKIPKDWDVKPLSELADVDRGKFTHRPRNDPRFYGGSYPFIQTGDIANSSGGILSTYSQTLNERGITVSREFPVGTIAITIAANIADTAILGIPMFFPDSVVGAVVKKPNSIRYVELCIRRAKQRLDARAPQSAQKNINLEDLRPLLIPVPSPEEQHRIAEVIDTIDSTIAHTSSLIAKLKQMKAGLLHDLLTRGLDENGELRDAIGYPEQFKDSLLGQIPKDWEVVTVADIATDVTDGDHHTPERSDSGVFLLSARNVLNGYLALEDVDFVPEHEYQRMIRRCNPEPGDILISCSGTIGRVCEVPANFRCVLVRSAALVKLEPTRCQSRFIEAVLQSDIVQSQILMEQLQAAQPNLFQGSINCLRFALPPLNEQERISKIIDTHNNRIRTEEAYRDKLKLQKQGLMHDLLTGKVRVKDVDKFTSVGDTV